MKTSNRVRSKPYIQQPESAGRDDDVVADEAWRRPRWLKSQSMITSLFTGQFRSTLTCSSCGYRSACFDPFSTLSLPLPHSTYRAFHCDPRLAGKLTSSTCGNGAHARLRGTSTVADLKTSIASMASTWYRRILSTCVKPRTRLSTHLGLAPRQHAQPSPHRRRPVVMQIDWSAVRAPVAPPPSSAPGCHVSIVVH